MSGSPHKSANSFAENPDYVALNTFTPGRRGTIIALPRERQHRERLLSLGLSVGQIIQISHHGAAGTIVTVVEPPQRIALNHQVADKIWVLPVPETDKVGSAVARLKHIWSLSS